MDATIRLLGINKLADHFGVSESTIRHWVKLGLPYLQPSGEGGKLFFDLAEAESWIKNQRGEYN